MLRYVKCEYSALVLVTSRHAYHALMHIQCHFWPTMRQTSLLVSEHSRYISRPVLKDATSLMISCSWQPSLRLHMISTGHLYIEIRGRQHCRIIALLLRAFHLERHFIMPHEVRSKTKFQGLIRQASMRTFHDSGSRRVVNISHTTESRGRFDSYPFEALIYR